MPTVSKFEIKTKFHWYQRAFTNVLDKTKNNTPKALAHYTKALKKKLNVPGFGIPSFPGDPPKKQTGKLQASPRTRSIKVGKGEVVFRVIATNVDYANYLEYGTSKMAPRPAWIPTFLEEQDRMIEIIRGK